MTRAVRAPGLDRAPAGTRPNANYSPARGAGGVFAQTIQGATPKYAINNGFRADLYRNTMARMFIRVDASEMPTFLGSIGDTHTRNQLASRLAGDPSPPQEQTNIGSAGVNDASVRRNTTPQTNGYLDFFIQNVQMPLQEKIQVSETLSDNYVAYAFGQSPPSWNFSGALINSVQDDQASNMFRLYTQILRATQMARRQKSLSLSFDSYILNGVMVNMNMSLSAANELMVPFSFMFLVKRVFITNYTPGWVPTRATTPFAADLNAIAYDGRPREETTPTSIAARIPTGAQNVTPIPQTQADGRTSEAPPATTPNFLRSTISSFIQDLGQPSPLIPAATGLGQGPLLPAIPARPISPAASVQNASRPETANPPGVSLNRSVNPATPEPNRSTAQPTFGNSQDQTMRAGDSRSQNEVAQAGGGRSQNEVAQARGNSPNFTIDDLYQSGVEDEFGPTR